MTALELGLIAAASIPYIYVLARLVFGAYYKCKADYNKLLFEELSKESDYGSQTAP